jgi:hypothetical protein
MRVTWARIGLAKRAVAMAMAVGMVAVAVADANHNLAKAELLRLIQLSGTVDNTDEHWCVFNNWEDRDNRASAARRFDNRYSVAGTFGGRWYCYLKG